MKSTPILLLIAALCCWCVAPAAATEDQQIKLRPGDSLRILLDDGAPESPNFQIDITALAPQPAAAVPAQAPAAATADVEEWETVMEVVCVNGVCSLQPVRRLVKRSAAVTKAAAAAAMAPLPAAPITAGRAVWYSTTMTGGGVGCGCGCPDCTCHPAGTMTRTMGARRLWRPSRLGWFWFR